jgi:hypothetical protein
VAKVEDTANTTMITTTMTMTLGTSPSAAHEWGPPGSRAACAYQVCGPEHRLSSGGAGGGPSTRWSPRPASPGQQSLAAVDTSRSGCDPHGSQSLRTPAAPSEKSRDGVGGARGGHPRISGPDQRQLGSAAAQRLPSGGQRRGRPSRTRTGSGPSPMACWAGSRRPSATTSAASALHPGSGTIGLAPSSSGADAANTRRPLVRPPRSRRPGQCSGTASEPDSRR